MPYLVKFSSVHFSSVHALVQNEKAVFIECSALCIVTEPNVHGMFLGITNISATFYMCFERLENSKYKTHILQWATYSNIRVNKTFLGNRNYWPHKHNTLYAMLWLRNRVFFSEYAGYLYIQHEHRYGLLQLKVVEHCIAEHIPCLC